MGVPVPQNPAARPAAASAGPETGDAAVRVRGRSRDSVVAAVREAGELSRAGLAVATGLSRATLSTVVGELLAAGVLVESPAQARAGRGRTARPLRLAGGVGLVGAMAFGNCDLHAALGDLGGRVLGERRVEFAVGEDADAALDTAQRVLRELLAETGRAAETGGLAHVVLGLPCSIDERTARVSYNEILPGWMGRYPAAELASRCGCPVTVENDANLAALGEHAHGAARDVRDLIYVKASRGIGAGLVLGGRLYRGATGVAGNLGHVIVAPGGEICRCGNRGCLETIASVPRVLAGVGAASGRPVRVEELAELVRGGNMGARRTVADAGHRIGQCLGDLCGVLNPAVVVVGGELAETGAVFVSAIQDSLTRYTQPVVAEAVSVRGSGLGARAEMLGGLVLAAAGVPPRIPAGA